MSHRIASVMLHENDKESSERYAEQIGNKCASATFMKSGG